MPKGTCIPFHSNMAMKRYTRSRRHPLFTSTYGSLSWDGFVKVITMIGTKMVSQTKWQQERIPAGTMQSSLPTPHLLLCKTTPDKGFLNLRCYLWFQSLMETVRCGSISRMGVWLSVSVIKPFSVNTHYASIDCKILLYLSLDVCSCLFDYGLSHVTQIMPRCFKAFAKAKFNDCLLFSSVLML